MTVDQENKQPSLKQTLKGSMPAPVWQAASDARYALQRMALWPAATFHPWRRASIRQLGGFERQTPRPALLHHRQWSQPETDRSIPAAAMKSPLG